ncbi:four helix bundle protein [Candidatus Uhrbacteria bacterium]|nr:four helix bundle protein [Candidatus Uhrbacteria bacterium]
MGEYIDFHELEIYKLAHALSKLGWEIYTKLSWEMRKVIGIQCITAIDSVGANIAEGYGRYHFLDRIKFFYNSRASLYEVIHWIDLMREREVITDGQHAEFMRIVNALGPKLNRFIQSQYEQKTKSF